MRHGWLVAGLLWMAMGLLVSARAGSAATWQVSPSGDDANDGTSWKTAKRTIQAAVEAAAQGDIVLVTEGTYVLTKEVSIEKGIIVRSVKGPAVTVVDGRHATRCFNATDTDAMVEGFTVTNGEGPRYGEGGGIYNWGTIRNCIIRGNSVYRGAGGGVYNQGVVCNCTIIGNSAGDVGGGAYNQGTLRNCLITGNVAYSGGGVFNFTNCIIQSCTITGNATMQNGGGICNFGTVANSIVYFNQVDDISCPGGVGPNSIRYCCTTLVFDGEGSIEKPPLFVSQGTGYGPSHKAGDYRLSPGSPGINAGENQDWMKQAKDLLGTARIVDGKVDLGAYEYQGAQTPSPPAGKQD